MPKFRVEWEVSSKGLCIKIVVFESDEQEFSLIGVKSKKINSYIERDLLNSVLKVRNAWVKVEWVEREELSVICTKVVVNDSREREEIGILRGNVHDDK